MPYEFTGTGPTNVQGIGRVLNLGDIIDDPEECAYIKSLPENAVKRLFKITETLSYKPIFDKED